MSLLVIRRWFASLQLVVLYSQKVGATGSSIPEVSDTIQASQRSAPPPVSNADKNPIESKLPHDGGADHLQESSRLW